MDKNTRKSFYNLFNDLVLNANNNGLYSDFNIFSKVKDSINIDNLDKNIQKSSDLGLKFRIYDGEKFLEYATTNLNKSNIISNFNFFLKKAKTNSNNLKEKILLRLDKTKINKEFSNKKEKNPTPLKLNVKKIETIKNQLNSYSKNIVNSKVMLVSQIEENLFVNSYKNLYQELFEYTLIVIVFVKSNDGSIRTVYQSFVSNYLDDIFNKFKLSENEFKSKINNIQNAKKLKGGKYITILSPKLTGLLAHESFGHGMEADTMLKDRALASNFINKKIGKENVNIVDYPNIEGKHGSFYFDHEGNLAKKTYLVKNGTINQPMGDLYSKSRLKLENSSNSRFETFDHKNYVRMSNTYFEAGNDLLDDMIKSINDGIIIWDSSGGMEDPKGWGVQIQGNFGQRIKNGKLIDEFYDGFALTGFLPDLIKNISAISNEIKIEGGGSCGKGHKEWVRVSEGGPYIKIDEVILG